MNRWLLLTDCYYVRTDMQKKSNTTNTNKASFKQKIRAQQTNAPKAKTGRATRTKTSTKTSTGTKSANLPPTLELAKERLSTAKDWVVANARSPKVIIPGALVLVYICCSLFFSSHYLPGTTINGVDVSMRSPKIAVRFAQEEKDSYAIQVDGNGVDLLIKAADIDLSLDPETFRNSAQAHLPSWLWPVGLILPRNYSITEGVTYDEGKLESVVGTAVDEANEHATYPKSASISYDESEGGYVAVKETDGTAIDAEKTMASVAQGVSTLQEHVELGTEELLQPAVRVSGNNMNTAIEEANRLAQIEIPLTIKGEKVQTVGSELIRSWITIDKDYNVTTDLDAITEWTRGELSSKVDTVSTARFYTRPSDNKTIEVYGGGTYGWSLDGYELAELIAQRLADGSSEAIEIPMKSEAEVVVRGKQDWGPRYLDIDLTEQYVRFFGSDSQVIMESECVSGNKDTDDETPSGVYFIENKEMNKKLIGLDNDEDGEPDYESDVTFWMPFFGGYGLHDALWRDYFGEDVYQYSGSHGCVNLPYNAAEKLYKLIKVGDVVVVHY